MYKLKHDIYTLSFLNGCSFPFDFPAIDAHKTNVSFAPFHRRFPFRFIIVSECIHRFVPLG